MLHKHQVVCQILSIGVVAIVRTDSAERATQIVDACLSGGLSAVELTFTVDNAHRIIEELHKSLGDSCILGAGTVLDAETARIAILSGASYIVSPHFNANIALCCNRYAIPYMAGCVTPTEMVAAMEAGVEIIKLFPATSFSPSVLKALRAPLPQANFMPTGGINAKNAKDWINAGAVALGIGGDLVAGDFAQVTQKAHEYRKIVTEAREVAV